MPTITGERPEVVAAVIDKIRAPLGAIAGRFFPKITVAEKASTISYKTLDADIEDELTTRSSETADYSRYTLSDASAEYTCREVAVPYQAPVSREKSYGSVEKVDQAGVSAAGRAVLRRFELDAANKILSHSAVSGATDLIDGAVIYGLTEAGIDVARYAGETVLAGSTRFIANLILSSDISQRFIAMMGNGGLTSASLASAIKNKPEIIGNMLGTFLPISTLLVGDDLIWGRQGNIGIVARVPTLEQASTVDEFDQVYTSESVFGGAPWFMPDPSAPDNWFSCRSYFDESNDCDVYKAKAWYDQVIFNSGAIKLVKFTSPILTTTPGA